MTNTWMEAASAGYFRGGLRPAPALAATGLLAVVLTGCPVADAQAAQLPPARSADFTCKVRDTTATPPMTKPPALESLAGAGQGAPEPVHLAAACPAGQVPVTTRIDTRYFHKGNPRLRAYIASGPEHALPPDFVNQRLLLTREQFTNHERVDPVRETPIPLSSGANAAQQAPACDGVAYFGSCYYYGSAYQYVTADGAGMTFDIEWPLNFEGEDSGHSIDEIAVETTPDTLTDVEMGWNVSASQYGDINPHLFVYHWINGLGTCYDTCKWNQYGSTYYPGMSILPLVGKSVYMGWVHANNAWWAWFNDEWIGYINDSEWSGTFTKASLIQWYGEIASSNGVPPRSQMGNGLFAEKDSSASMTTLCDVNATKWTCSYGDQQSTVLTDAAYYDIVNHTAYGGVRYGGPGQTGTVTPAVEVTPSLTKLLQSKPLSVAVAVGYETGNPSPTGTVKLSSGTYTSAAAALSSGNAQINIPANSLAAGAVKLAVEYTPNSRSAPTYSKASGIATVNVTGTRATPTVTLTPSAITLTTLQALNVKVVVAGPSGKPKPTGTVKLTSGSYSSKLIALTSGAATIAVPAKTLPAGTDKLTVTYTPGSASVATYNSASASRTIVIRKALQTVSFTAPPSQVKYGVAPIVLKASASSGLPIVFAVTGPAKLSGAKLTITGAGTVVIVAKQAGNAFYSPAEASHTIKVVKATSTVTP